MFGPSLALDYLTPADFSSSLLYAPPILFLIVFVGTGWGIASALLATVLWTWMNNFQGNHWSSWMVASWNVLFRLVFFLMVPLMARLQQLRNLERSVSAENAASARLKTRMISMVSRDFGNALTDFRTALGVLRGSEPENLPEDRRLSYEALEQIVRRWDQTVTHFLELTRLESGRFDLNRSRVPIVPMIRDALAVLSPLVERKELTVSVQAPPEQELYCVDADPEALRLIIGNLLSNVVRFAPKGGRLRVNVERDPKAAPETLIAFEETGASAPEPAAAEVGVAICRELIESHGSELVLGNTPGESFRFSFRLPAA